MGAGITSNNISSQFITKYASKKAQEFLYNLSIFKIVKKADITNAVTED